jgi:hypothetical protein
MQVPLSREEFDKKEKYNSEIVCDTQEKRKDNVDTWLIEELITPRKFLH